MREILFRGKRVDNKKWVYGYLSFIYWDVPEKARIYSPDEARSFDVITETIGQFTGLCDKNDKKIFEGDILQVEQCGKPGSRPFSIYFGEYIDADSDFDYPCIGFYIKIPDGCCNIGALLTDGFEYEVIGNIHDNPELMEV